MSRMITIPFGIVFQKFYCHKCGEQLKKVTKTRTVKRGDPDYRQHSRIVGIHVVGDIQVTEYAFSCPHCGHSIDYHEQSVVAKIQKQLGERQLSDGQIEEKRPDVEAKKRKNETVWKVVCGILVILFIAYHLITNGKIQIYF